MNGAPISFLGIAEDVEPALLHAELAHLAVQVGAVQAEQAGRFGHVPFDSLDRAADVFLLELDGRVGQAKVGSGVEERILLRGQDEGDIFRLDRRSGARKATRSIKLRSRARCRASRELASASSPRRKG